jgi:hypothetical protein
LEVVVRRRRTGLHHLVARYFQPQEAAKAVVTVQAVLAVQVVVVAAARI